MTKIAASEVRKDFADTINRVAFGNERIVLHRRGERLSCPSRTSSSWKVTVLVVAIGHRKDVRRGLSR